jgi:hypothetical protein
MKTIIAVKNKQVMESKTWPAHIMLVHQQYFALKMKRMCYDSLSLSSISMFKTMLICCSCLITQDDKH